MKLYFLLLTSFLLLIVSGCKATITLLKSGNNTSLFAPVQPGYTGGYKNVGHSDIVVDATYIYASIIGTSSPFRIYSRATKALVGDCTTCKLSDALVFQKNGNIIYASGMDSNYDAGFEIIDISNPASPASVGFYRLKDSASTPWSVMVNGNTAFLSVDNGKVVTLDITIASSIVEVHIQDFGSSVEDAVAQGSYLYVAHPAVGLKVMDMTVPTAPVLVATVATAGADNIMIIGSTLYLSDWTGGVKIIDISTPTAPVVLSTLATPGKASEVEIKGSYMYISDYSSGLQIVDISTPAAPVIVHSVVNAGSFIYNAFIDGNTLFTFDDLAGLREIDITNPLSASVTNDFPDFISHEGRTVSIVGNRAYLVSAKKGLLVLDITNKAAPTLLGSFKLSGDAHSAQVIGSHAFMVYGGHGLIVVDISNPAAMTQVGQYNTPGYAGGEIVIDGNYAFVGDNTSIQIIDITNPLVPSFVSSIAASTGSYLKAVKGNYLFVGDNGVGLKVFDISIPATPVLSFTYGAVTTFSDIHVYNDSLYITDGAVTLTTLNISNPALPVASATITLASAKYLDINQGVLYVGGRNLTSILTLQDPLIPVFLNRLYVYGDVRTIIQDGDTLYFAGSWGGFSIFGL